MSLQQLAQSIQSQGRGNDTMLVHMTPGEVAGLQALAQANGGSLTVNPQTGLPEAGFLEDILPMVAGAAAMFIPGMQGVGAYMLAGGIGGLTAMATKRKGESGFDAFLRGAIGGAAGGFGGAALGAGSGAAAAGTGAAEAAFAATPMADAATYALMGDFSAPVAQGLAASAGTGTGALLTGYDGVAAAGESLMPYGAEYDAIQGMYEGVGGSTQLLSPADTSRALQYAELTSDVPVGMQNNLTSADVFDSLSPSQQAEYGFNKAKDWWDETSLTNKLYAGKQVMDMAAPREAPAQQVRGPAVGTPGYNPANVDMPSVGGGGGSGPYQGSASRIEVPTFAQLAQARAQQRAGFGSGWGAFPSRRAAEGGLIQLAEGGVVHMEDGGFVTSADVVSALGKGSTDAGLRVLAALGAEPIRGPGDGQSDSIHATIDGEPVARVADGEAYFPPQAVARIGGGDHRKGAQRLYAMMDKVRKQAYGRAEQVKPVDIDEALV
jgi:hypothetical protein